MKLVDKDKNKKNLLSSLMIFSYPAMFSNFLIAVRDILDMVFVGHIFDAGSAQAAISISWPFLDTMLAPIIGFCVAGMNLIGESKGKEDKKSIRKYSTGLIILCILSGIGINLIIFFSAPYVLRFMKASNGIIDNAIIYVRIRSVSYTFEYLFRALSTISYSNKNTKTPTWFSFFDIVLDVIICAVLLFVFNVGIAGIAVASTASRIFTALAYTSYLMMKQKSLEKNKLSGQLKGSFTKGCIGKAVNNNYIRRILKQAAPVVFSQALSCIGFYLLLKLIIVYGADVSAAFGIGNKISNLVLAFAIALSSTLAVKVSISKGENDKESANKVIRYAEIISLVISVIGGTVLYFIGSIFTSIMTKDINVANATKEYLRWLILVIPMMGEHQIIMGAMQGLGKTKNVMWLSVFRIWFTRLPILTVFIFLGFTQSQYVWYMTIISSFLAMLFAFLLLFISGKNR